MYRLIDSGNIRSPRQLAGKPSLLCFPGPGRYNNRDGVPGAKTA